MHRLVAYAHDGVRRFPLDRDVVVLGSGPECDIRLPFSGVGAVHARLVRSAEGLEIEDLGESRRGVLVNGQRVRRSRIRVLDEIRLGNLALLVEDELSSPSLARPKEATESPRVASIDAASMLEHLARVSRWVLAESRAIDPLETVVDALLEDFGGGVLFLLQGERGIKFVAASEARWLGAGSELLEQLPPTEGPRASGSLRGSLGGSEAWIGWCRLRALDRDYVLLVAFPTFRPAGWSPESALRTLADQLVLGLIHHVGRFEPLVLVRPPSSELRLPEGLVTGESPAIRELLVQLQSGIESPSPILFVGEEGVSKELFARAVHASGSRRAEVLVVCACGGDRPETVEIDLFGALLPGRGAPLVRRGKLAQAAKGTLVLLDVERLSLRAQDRLMRVLRSGEVEPAGEPTGEHPTLPFEGRIVATSRIALSDAVARGTFRADLAYRLEGLTLRVPSLRERREDLPLLIQTAVNRACHETGKRVQGITVDAMEALTGYDYPGNLPELESIIRRLIYVVPTGRPIDENLLPERIRVRALGPEDVETRPDLDLETLVADCERRAIGEALRRAEGNKSAAARLLGLSRNGLSSKLRRLKIDLSGGGR